MSCYNLLQEKRQVAELLQQSQHNLLSAGGILLLKGAAQDV